MSEKKKSIVWILNAPNAGGYFWHFPSPEAIAHRKRTGELPLVPLQGCKGPFKCVEDAEADIEEKATVVSPWTRT